MKEQKKVCHVTSLHPANDGRIFERECKSLSKKYDVYLVAPNTETRKVNGVNIVGVELPSVNHRLKRWLRLNIIFKTLLDIDADVYHFHDPELIGMGLKLKRRGKKVIFDSHEDVPMLILAKNYIPLRKLVSNLYALYERYVLKQYSALVSVTVHIVQRLRNINPNTYQITNYPKYEERVFSGEPELRSICFAGLISRNWKLENIIDILPQANAQLYLAGRCFDECYLKELQSLDGWKNVAYLGVLSHEKVLEIYSKCRLGLAIESYESPNAGYKTGSLGCTKIPDYMASSLPVVVSNSLVWGDIFRKYECGAVVNDPNNKNEISAVIRFILDNPDKAKIMGENAKRAAIEEFNWGSQEPVLFRMYEGLIND